MDPITLLIIGSIFSALASAGASVGSAYMNKKSVEETNEQNVELANKANETEVELANTAHQREVADLKAAGLNPVLSAGGAGSPVSALNVPTKTAPQTDLSGVSSALTALSNLLLVGSIVGQTKVLPGQGFMKKAYAGFSTAKGISLGAYKRLA